MQNSIRDLLEAHGLIDPDAVTEIFPRVRDRDDVRVMRCPRSGIIFLSRTDHLDIDHYQDKTQLSSVTAGGVKVPSGNEPDDERRAADFRELIRSRRWLDFGTGAGAILDLLAPVAAEAVGIEANRLQREQIARRGHQIFGNLESLGNRQFDCITLFHVFEHLHQPIELLARLRDHLADGGTLVVEVPHARDLLIDTLDCEAFRAFTFWSEHLILHTRHSLETFIRAAGFGQIGVVGYQRYPLSNHLHWLRHGQPGGHREWAFLGDPDLDRAYAGTLKGVDRTDTLIAYARPGGEDR